MKKIIVVFTSIVGILLISFLLFFNFHFMPGSKINETDISFKTPLKAFEIIPKNNNDILILKDDVETVTIQLNDFSNVILDSNKVKNILKENKYKVVENNFKWDVSYDYDKLQDEIQAINNNRHRPENAQIIFDEEEYEYKIKEEINGNYVDLDRLMSDIKNGLDNNIFEYNLEDYYLIADIISTNEDLIKEINDKNKMYSTVINYELFDDQTFVVDKKIFGSWFGNNGEINVEDVSAFVNELAEKVDTVGKQRTFESQNGTIEVSGGAYGWKLDTDKEIQNVINDILSQQVVNRRPNFKQEARSYSINDIGDTYVEVDVTNQHLYFVEDGKLRLDCDVVTGMKNDPNRRTTTGVHYIWAMNSNRYLDGPTWHCFVNRFMPFCGGEGFHDATWRNKFGGNIYENDGSHGCVNMPKDKVIELYELVDIGTPVVIYSEDY